MSQLPVHPLHRQTSRLGVAALACLAVAAVLALAGDDLFEEAWAYLAAVMFGTVALILGAVWLFMRPVVARADREIAALARGEYLAHWQYSADGWRRFAVTEQSSQELGWHLPLIVGSLLGGLCGLGFISLAGYTAPFWGAVAGAVFFGSMAALRRVVIRHRLAVPDDAAPEVYITNSSVFFNGRYVTWRAPGTKLLGVSITTEGTPALQFHLAHATNTGEHSNPLRLPIPDGKDDEARHVVASLGPIGSS